jgi:hypothetical protein
MAVKQAWTSSRRWVVRERGVVVGAVWDVVRT